MSKRPRRKHSPAFKAKVALAAVKGEKTLTNDFLAGALGKAGLLRAQSDDRSLAQFAVGAAGTGTGDQPGQCLLPARPVSEADLAIMRCIDELHLELPFAGSRMLRDLLRQEGMNIGRQHVATLMKKLGTSINMVICTSCTCGGGFDVVTSCLGPDKAGLW